MSDLVVCSNKQCQAVESRELATIENGIVLCSQCATGTWHGFFPKEKYDPSKHKVINRPSGIGLG